MASIRLEVGVSIRKTIERREEESLSEFACLASASRGREKPEELGQVRTCFQRDRDRILHSKSFRRLKHKTQVFIAPQGDHFRTRLTHSLEVAQISRTVGRALCLNEDLIEAIALGHDVGHTPFGHAGEQAIDDALKNKLAGIENNPGRFRHYEHSLRIVDVLEDLNLSAEVREGISGHSKGRSDLSEKDGEVTSTLEASVVRICDRIAYLNHDLDDAIRAGILTSVPDSFLALGSSHGKRISAMVIDVIENSLDQPQIKLSPNMLSHINELKELLFKEVYLKEPNQSDQVRKAKRLVKELLCYYSGPGHLPHGFSGIQGAIDYVAGMTDRFAIRKYSELFVPMEFQEVVALIR